MYFNSIPFAKQKTNLLKKLVISPYFMWQNIIISLHPYIFCTIENWPMHTMHRRALQGIIMFLFEKCVLHKVNLWHNFLGAGKLIERAIKSK